MDAKTHSEVIYQPSAVNRSNYRFISFDREFSQFSRET